MKKQLGVVLVLLMILSFVPQSLANSVDRDQTNSLSKKMALLRQIDPVKQSYDSVYLTDDLKEKYGFNFTYRHDTSWKLPEEFIKNSTTEELAVAVFSHPEMYAITCYSDKEFGFTEVYNRFDGLRELLSRKDLGKVVTDLFLILDIEKENSTDLLMSNLMLRSSLEQALNLSAFSSIFSDEEIESIQIKTKENYLSRVNMRENKDLLSYAVENSAPFTFEFDGSILKYVCIQDFEEVSRSYKDNVQSRSATDPIEWRGETAYIEGEILKYYTYKKYHYTKGGTWYDVVYYLDELSLDKRNSLDATMRNLYNLSPLYKATVMYNCNGYGWLGSRWVVFGDAGCFMDDSLHSGLRAESTDALNNANFLNKVSVGDILVPWTGSSSHSSRVTSKIGNYIVVNEKWDAKGEYQYELGIRTPYYNPGDTSPAASYGLRAYYLK